MTDPLDVLIIGAGLAGILAAHTLAESGKTVRLLDKGRHPGGRMATRSRDGANFDYGAQFFTTRDPAFVAVVENWEQNYDLDIWCHGFPTPAELTNFDDGHPRYAVFEGMARLMEELCDSLDVRTNVRVVRLAFESNRWLAWLEDGTQHEGRSLLLTPPLPQSLTLLRESGIGLPAPTSEILAGIEYDPCLALLIQLSGPGLVPEPGAIRPAGEPIHILVDNYRKGVSRRPGAITLHAGPVFSRTHFASPEAEILAPLLEAAQPWLGATRERVELHRWRYSHPVRVHTERLVCVPEMRLAFAGDAFGGPRVEGAALSGQAAGLWLAQLD